MANVSRRSGATLPELLILLTLLSILLGMSMSATARTRDGLAVRSSRDIVAADIGRARALARLHGSARVRIEGQHATLVLEAPPDTVLATTDLSGAGVTVSVDGASSGAVSLEFDALGLGRLANRTIRFRRNEAEARLTLSAYGRPRRW